METETKRRMEENTHLVDAQFIGQEYAMGREGLHTGVSTELNFLGQSVRFISNTG